MPAFKGRKRAQAHYCRVYEVHELLGRLREATFSDRLYLRYLHALTSHQLVDPLTKRTGIEEAREGLKGEVISFHTLGRRGSSDWGSGG
jgi:hypothetical protein